MNAPTYTRDDIERYDGEAFITADDRFIIRPGGHAMYQVLDRDFFNMVAANADDLDQAIRCINLIVKEESR